MAAVVKVNPNTAMNNMRSNDDRIDILSRRLKSMEETLATLADDLNKTSFNVKTNSELLSSYDERIARIAEATCDNFNKTEEQIEGLESSVNDVKTAVKYLDEKMELNKNDISTGGANDTAQVVVKKVESDESFWMEIIRKANSLTHGGTKKPEIALIFAKEYGYGEEFWDNVLGLIWTARKSKVQKVEVAKTLNSRFHVTLTVKEIACTPCETSEPVNVGENVKECASKDSFLDILHMMGYEILDKDERYTVKDASGRTCEVSRRALEKSMKDCFVLQS